MEPIKSQEDAENTAFFPELIYAYTRRQALEDGVLVDVTEAAREAGFAWPLAMTAEVWTLIVAIPSAYVCEDVAGRLWDVLMCARAKVLALPPGKDQALFDVILHHASGNLLRLKLVAGPGDQGEPVLTLMLPEQD